MILKYILFACVSIVVNLAFQYISFVVYAGFLSLLVAMIVGTLSGLIVKYLLDKNYIFYYETTSTQENAKKFILYSFMGVFTTLIFWLFEFSFDIIFQNSIAKYIGATIGLIVGYVVKYYLDKKFVFRSMYLS